MQASDAFRANLEELSMVVESTQRVLEKPHATLPKKGIKAFIQQTSKQLNKVVPEVGKVAALLNKYKEQPIDETTMQEFKRDLASLSGSIQKVTAQREAAAKKAAGLPLKVGLLKARKELKHDHPAEVEALQTLNTGVAAITQKIDDADCKKYFNYYKNMYQQGPIPEKSEFYFPTKFIEALFTPTLSNFARDLHEMIINNPEKLTEPFGQIGSLWDKFDAITKGLNLPGNDAELLVPFLRLVVLKMDDPSVLRDTTIRRLESIAERCDKKLAQSNLTDEQQLFLANSMAAISHLSSAIYGLKDNLRTAMAAESKGQQ